MTVLSCFDGRLPIILAAFVRFASGTGEFTPDSFTVASGRYFSFTVNNHVANATGRNNYGQLGIGNTEDQLLPTEVQLGVNDTDILDIAAGAFHTLFLTTTGTVYVSGWNKHGQLGLGAAVDMEKDPTLLTVEEGSKAIAIAAGYAHSLVLMDSGTVYAMGLNNAGQLGDGLRTSSPTPKPVVDFVCNSEARAERCGVAAGHDFSYFLRADGKVFAAGQNLGGQLGDGTRTNSNKRNVEVKVSKVTSMVAGESHGLFMLEDGSVRGTGANFIGQLGQGVDAARTPIAEPIEVVVPSISDNQRIYAGKDASCIIADWKWSPYCMGDNQDGQLGFGTQTSIRVPTLVPDVPDEGAEGVGLGYAHSLFLVHPGDVYVAGSNNFGELGTNNTESLTRVLKNEFMQLDFQETTPRTTIAPTPAPTPPSGTTAGPTRDPNSAPGDGPTRELVWIWIGAIVIGIIALVINVLFQRQGARQMEDEDDVPNQNELELMRNELDA